MKRNKSSIARPPQNRYGLGQLALALSLSTGACMTGPFNGTTDPAASVIGHALSFAGYDETPGTPVNIQVLVDPEHDPLPGSNWVTIGTATTSVNPFYWNSSQPLYQWVVSATPVPSLAEAARWPQGGVMRVRATTSEGLATIFDEDFVNKCFIPHASESWDSIGTSCASGTAGIVYDQTGTSSSIVDVAAIVSTTPNPTDVVPTSRPAHFLNKKACLTSQQQLPNQGPDQNCNSTTDLAGTITKSDTTNYYQAIGAPQTLDCFKAEFGFGNNGHCANYPVVANASPIDAIYYNVGDLGVGRHMHCQTLDGWFDEATGWWRTGVACYVSNYSAQTDAYGLPSFGADSTTAIGLAVYDARRGNEAQAFATVAMVYLRPLFPGADNNTVRFMVYDGNGNLSPEARLDSTAFNTGVPTNCTVCHGGRLDTVAHAVSGAAFLPFDPDNLAFSSAYPESDPGALVPTLRALNKLVLTTNPPAVEANIILGLYGGNMASGVPNSNYVPAGYQGSPTAVRVYQEVIKPYCRGCHESSIYPFATFSDLFPPAGAPANTASLVGNDVCYDKAMPQAEQTRKRLWASPARAHLLGGLGLTTSCKP